MESNASPKQIQTLLKAGYDVQEILAMDKQTVHQKIGEHFEKIGYKSPDKKPPVVNPYKQQKSDEKPLNKHSTMYVSYAKDLIVSGMTPTDAVDTIQMLKEKFE